MTIEFARSRPDTADHERDHSRGWPLTLTWWASSISRVGTIVHTASWRATPLGAVHPP